MSTISAHWKTVKLAEVAESRLGKMLDSEKNRGEPRPYLRNPNVRWFGFELADLRQMPFEEFEEEKFSIKCGDVLVCEGGEAGRAAIWEGPDQGIKFQKALHRVRCGPRLHNRYLVHRLMYDYFNGGLDDYYTGVTIKHLTGQDLARYSFPLPPLDEQRRIAAMLDQAEAIRRKRKDSLAKLTKLEGALFASIPNDQRRLVGDLCKVLGGKRLPKGEDYSEEPAIHRYIRLVDIENGGVRESGLRYLKAETQRKIARYTVGEGDIIISIAGSIGLVAEVSASLAGSNLTENAAKLVPRGSISYNHTFLAGMLRQPSSQSQMAAKAGQVTISKLALFRIEQIEIPFPDLTIQDAIAERLRSIKAAQLMMERHLSHLDALFASLQHRAFTGQLTRSDERLLESA